VRRADNLTTLMRRLFRNPGALTSRTPQGHVGLFRGYFTFYTTYIGHIKPNGDASFEKNKDGVVLKLVMKLGLTMWTA
jgi:hypothetical protein